jgi:hypothetical protein
LFCFRKDRREAVAAIGKLEIVDDDVMNALLEVLTKDTDK